MEIKLANHQIPLEAQEDLIKKITTSNPVKALSELIWNGLDADASSVNVSFKNNELDNLEKIIIKDNGMGIPRDKAEIYFKNLGGSWKRQGGTTPSGRFLHGQEGRGRLNAFSLGSHSEWAVVYEKEEKLYSYAISMSSNNIKYFSMTEEKEVFDSPCGVTLTISNPHKDFNFYKSDAGISELNEIFALYIFEYSNVEVTIAGFKLIPQKLITRITPINLSDIIKDGKSYPTRLEIIEWSGIQKRNLFLCNERRFPLLKIEKRFQVGNYWFTAYLASSFVNKLQKEETVELAEMHKEVDNAIEEASKALKTHFRERAAADAQSYVADWKSEKIYPYQEAPQNQIEEVERQVFDIVAVNVARHLPDFETAKTKNKAFQLRMIRQAIENGPEDLQLILDEVLKLPKRKQEELAELLQDVSLSSIIGSAKIVADRVKFINGLEVILFDPEPKKRLKERSQLHRIIAQNTWLFGEEYSLSVDDKSLTEVLRQHKKHLNEDIVIDEPVKHISKERGIVDLMLSRSTRSFKANSTRHLIVELKAPKVKINSKEITQIKEYAISLVKDERFSKVDVQWEFWALSDELGEVGQFEVTNGDGDGLIFNNNNVKIYLKTWAQILDENKARMQFFQSHLEYQADKSSSIQFLQEKYSQYLEGVFAEEEAEEDKDSADSFQEETES